MPKEEMFVGPTFDDSCMDLIGPGMHMIELLDKKVALAIVV
jgi:hypothetical protein